jgi:hypothetical protein
MLSLKIIFKRVFFSLNEEVILIFRYKICVNVRKTRDLCRHISKYMREKSICSRRFDKDNDNNRQRYSTQEEINNIYICIYVRILISILSKEEKI